MRRRPVPRAWREDHHELGDARTRIAGGGWGGWSRTYRYGATCSCGQAFGLNAGVRTMNQPEVLDAWKDHVEAAYYAEKEESDGNR